MFFLRFPGLIFSVWAVLFQNAAVSFFSAHSPVAEATPRPSAHDGNLPQLYEIQGTMDVGTLENSIFSWHGSMYLLENIGCGYLDHFGKWNPAFKGHSYARIRELDTGIVVANISETIDFAFISAFPDYVHDRLWLFGIDFNRCDGTKKGSNVQGFWNTNGGADLISWSSAVAISDFATYNVEVASVNNSESALLHAATGPNRDPCFDQGRALCDEDPNCAAFGTHATQSIQLHGCVSLVEDSNPWQIYNRSANYATVKGSVNVDEGDCNVHPRQMQYKCDPNGTRPLPPHRYVMILEPFNFMVNNAEDGNLTSGWVQIETSKPPAASGGPSIRHSRGYYYIIAGGDQVRLVRTQDFQAWERSTRGSLVYPMPANDSLVAPFAGFNLSASTQGGPANETNAERKGFADMQGANATKWDRNSNDGDVCCMEPGSTDTWLVWGASSQGRPCGLSSCCTNAIGHAPNTSLPDLLEAMFLPA